MESFLKYVDRKEWTDVIINSINDDIIKQLDVTKLSKHEDSYDVLKQSILDRFVRQTTDTTAENEVNITQLVKREQGAKETIQNFGDAITRMAQKVIKGSVRYEEIIRNQFVQGLSDTNAREIGYAKLLKEPNISAAELIRYVAAKVDVKLRAQKSATESEITTTDSVDSDGVRTHNGERQHKMKLQKSTSKQQLVEQEPQQYVRQNSYKNNYNKNYNNKNYQYRDNNNNYQNQNQNNNQNQNKYQNYNQQTNADGAQQVQSGQPAQQSSSSSSIPCGQQPNQNQQQTPNSSQSQMSTQSSNVSTSQHQNNNYQQKRSYYPRNQSNNNSNNNNNNNNNNNLQNGAQGAGNNAMYTQRHVTFIEEKKLYSKKSPKLSCILGKAIFNNTLVSYMYDSGAARTIINFDTFQRIKNESEDPNRIVLEQNKGGNLIGVEGVIKIIGYLKLDQVIMSDNWKRRNVNVAVIENLEEVDCLLGRDWMNNVPDFKKQILEKTSTVQEMTQECVEINKKFNKEKKDNIINNSIKMVQNVVHGNSSENTKNEEIINVLNQKSSTKENENETEARKFLEEILQKNSATDPNQLQPFGHNDGVEFDIDFIDPKQKPITCKKRLIPVNLRQKVENELQSQLEGGIIRRSNSPWASPICVVTKPDGSIRITVDYKPLNRVIKLDRYPLPHIKNFFQSLHNDKYFSKIDLYKAYHQIPIAEKAIPITAFLCEFGLFEYVSMPMGIATAPACFQRYMELILAKTISSQCVNPYMDDVFIHTPQLDQHVRVVEEVLSIFERKQIKVSANKSEILVKRIEILGHEISEGSIKPLPRQADCIANMPKPVTINDLQRLLGATNYSRDHIRDYAEIVRPLFKMMDLKNVPNNKRKKNGAVDGKKVNLVWDDNTNSAFV